MVAKTGAASQAKAKGVAKGARTKAVPGKQKAPKLQAPPGGSLAGTPPPKPPTARKTQPPQPPNSLVQMDLTVDTPAVDTPAPKVRQDKARSECKVYLQRMSCGFYKKATKEEQEEAQEALDIYNDLAKDDKITFAKNFKASPKNLGFAKTYMEKRLTIKKTTEACNEKYRTRSVFRK